VCYAYLEDVTSTRSSSESYEENSEFRRSKWFTRGWTLQELIAPGKVLFFGKDWIYLGERVQLSDPISKVTRIQEKVLRNSATASRASVARRMSWASGRKTTRVEDLAYSLLGIFDVHMPLLYGEGDKAFLRLQEEILKDSDDQSLFAWNPSSQGLDSRGVLAPTPDYFQSSGNIVPTPPTMESQSYFMTNKGLYINIPLSIAGNRACALLDCQYETDFSGRLVIHLEETDVPNVYQRGWGLAVRKPVPNDLEICRIRTIYILKRSLSSGISWMQYDTFVIYMNVAPYHGYEIVEVAPNNVVWDAATHTLKKESSQQWAAFKLYNYELEVGVLVIVIVTRSGLIEVGGVKVVDIPLVGTIEQLLDYEEPWEKDQYRSVYRFYQDLFPNQRKLEHPLEVLAEVKTKEQLNQRVFALDITIRS